MAAFIRKATKEDARDIASRLRHEDRREALDYIGVSPALILPHATENPDTWVGCGDDGRPEVIFGVEPLEGVEGVGIVWLMATEEIARDYKKQIQFLRKSREVIEDLQDKYPILGNYVDERNELHLKWCKWLGFSVLKRVEKWGWRGKPFIQIIRTRKE